MLRVDSRVDSMPASNSLPANLETGNRVSAGHLETTNRVSAGHLETTNRVSAGHLETTSRVSTGPLETTGVGRRSAQDHHLHSSHHHQQHPHGRHLRPRPTSADVQPRCVRSAVAPPRLPAMSGVLQSSCPVIRPVAYRPTPNHTPSTTPTRLHGSEPPPSSSHRAAHYASASDLKQSGATITPGNTRLTRGKFESMDNLKLPSEEQYISPSVLVDDYRSSRITSTPASVRSCEPRRESFSDFTDSPGRRVVRHDSLKGMWNSGGGGGGVAVLSRSSMGGSVSNLTSHPGVDRRGDMVSGGYLHHHHPHHQQQRFGAQRSSSVTCDPRTSSSTGGSATSGGTTGCSSSNYGSSLTIAGGERHDSAGSGTTDPPSFSSLVGLRLDPAGNSTPSPSDSGVAELEAILKERDSEINFLRETMEQNEQVIFKVYEEKEKTWEKELRKIKAIYDNRLKATQQRALKMEQMLTTQTYQLQQEKRKLRQELDETVQEKQQLSQQYTQMKRELAELRTQLEDTEWALCQKTGEISLLKCQLKDSQGDRTTRGHEMLHIRAQVREYSAQLESKEAENRRLQAETSSLRQQTEELRTDETSVVIGQLQREIERLRGELSGTQSQLHDQKTDFEQERLHWLDEKQKVVSYQKQLQLNYMEMYKRNKSLETELLNRENKLNSSGESQC